MKETNKTSISAQILAQWPSILAVISLVSIALSLLANITWSEYKNLPLFGIIAVGGIPLCFQVIRKLLKGDFGSDLLAVIAFNNCCNSA